MQLTRSKAMSTLKLLGAVVTVLSCVIVTPVSAQAVIQEPGYCAFFYPNANCQNKGPGNPYTDPNYQRRAGSNDGMWPGGETVGMAGKRSRTRMQLRPGGRGSLSRSKRLFQGRIDRCEFGVEFGAEPVH